MKVLLGHQGPMMLQGSWVQTMKPHSNSWQQEKLGQKRNLKLGNMDNLGALLRPLKRGIGKVS